MSIYDNELPLGILRRKDPETYRALVEWHEAGKPVEVFFSLGWSKLDDPQMCECFAHRAAYEPPTAEEVDRLRRKVAAGEKLAAVLAGAIVDLGHTVPGAKDALHEWEAADE